MALAFFYIFLFETVKVEMISELPISRLQAAAPRKLDRNDLSGSALVLMFFLESLLLHTDIHTDIHTVLYHWSSTQDFLVWPHSTLT